MIKLKELLNEGPQKVGNINAFGASKVLGKGKKVLGFVPDTPNSVATLIQDFPQAMEIEFKQGFFSSDGKLVKSIKKGDKVWKELEKRFLDTATKNVMKAGFKMNEGPSVNEKSSDPFLDYGRSKSTKGSKTRVDRVAKYGNYKFEFDDKSFIVKLFYKGKRIAYGFPDWSTGGYIMNHLSWGAAEKKFESLEDIIKYFKSKKITTDGLEAFNEAKVKTPTEIVTSVPATAIPSNYIPSADVMLGLHMGGLLGRSTLTVRDYSLGYSEGKVALKLTRNGIMAVRVRSEKNPDYVNQIKKVADAYLMDYVKKIKK
jgi:hypothetical protein